MTAIDAIDRRRRRTTSLIAAIVTITVVDIGSGLTLPLVSLNLEARNVDAWIIGLNSAMAPLGIILFGPFMPKLAELIGGKRLALIAMAITALALAAFPLFFPSLPMWFLLRFVLGIAGGTLYTLSEAWILHFTEDETRGRVTGIYAAILSLSFSIGPFVIPFTGVEGPLPFLLAAAFVTISALPLVFVTLDEGDFSTHSSTGYFGFMAKAPLLLFAVATLTMYDAVMLAFFPIYAMRSGLDLQTATWALGIAIMGNAVLQFPVGWLVDHWSRMGVVWTAAIMTTVLSLALPVIIGTWLIWPTALLLGTGAYAIYTVALTLLGDHFRGADLVAGSAAFAAMWGVGGLLGPPIAGAALELLGPTGVPLFLALIYAVLIAGLAVCGGRLVRA